MNFKGQERYVEEALSKWLFPENEGSISLPDVIKLLELKASFEGKLLVIYNDNPMPT